jgi:hypothetical protein
MRRLPVFTRHYEEIPFVRHCEELHESLFFLQNLIATWQSHATEADGPNEEIANFYTGIAKSNLLYVIARS